MCGTVTCYRSAAPSAEPVTVDFVPPPTAGPLRLRIRYGPRDDWFTRAARELLETPYTMSVDSNRVGARLAGPALERMDAGRQLPSEGIVPAPCR